MIQHVTAVLPVPFLLERIENERLAGDRNCRHGPALRPSPVDQFSDSDGLEPASESTALVVEPEFDDGLRDFGEDFLNDFIGILWGKCAVTSNFEKKGTVQTIEFGPARRVRQVANPLDQGDLRGE